jgi:hypothetical protein
MPIIVEDGTGIPNANSYCDGDTIRAYALGGGITLPADDDTLLPLVTQAVLYLETFEDRFIGRCSYQGQSLSWPRQWASYRGQLFNSALIPQMLIDAECQLITEISIGIIFLPTILPQAQGGGFITSSKVDVIETHYSEKVGNTTDQPISYAVMSLLRPLLNTASNGLIAVRA